MLISKSIDINTLDKELIYTIQKCKFNSSENLMNNV